MRSMQSLPIAGKANSSSLLSIKRTLLRGLWVRSCTWTVWPFSDMEDLLQLSPIAVFHFTADLQNRIVRHLLHLPENLGEKLWPGGNNGLEVAG